MLSVHFTSWTTKPGQKTNFRHYSICRNKNVEDCVCDLLYNRFFSFCPLESVKCSGEVVLCGLLLYTHAVHGCSQNYKHFLDSHDYLWFQTHADITASPYHIGMHIYIHISPTSRIHACEYAYAKSLGPNTWNPVFSGDATEVWSESLLLGMFSYHLRQSSSNFLLISSFQIGSCEQFCICWLWTTILLISVSWDPSITRMRLWDWDLFGFFFFFFVTENEQELNNFFVVLEFELRGSCLISKTVPLETQWHL
jgi:hypothetical protein